MEKLQLRHTLSWTFNNASDIWDCYRFKKNINKGLGGIISEINSVKLEELSKDSISLSMRPYTVSKYGWLQFLLDSDGSDEWHTREIERCESVVQSGKFSGAPYGNPYERSTYCKAETEHIGKKVIKITITFTKKFQEIFRRESDVLLVIPSELVCKKKPVFIKSYFGDIYCPNWDKNHPDVLKWLEHVWKPAVEIEEATGINPLLDLLWEPIW